MRPRPGRTTGAARPRSPAGWPVPGDSVPNGATPLDHPDPPQGLGLAVIAGLADDVQFARSPAGLSITMSWPSTGTG